MIVIDKVSGAGFLFHKFKKVLNFKENLDWVIEKRIKEEEAIMLGLHYTSTGNSMLKYNILNRKLEFEGKVANFNL